MKTDTYTKVILTIIAVCLTLNVLKDFEILPKAYATEFENNLEIPIDYKLVPVNASTTMDVRIVDIATYDELNVNLKSVDTYDEVKVNLKSIDTSDELDVNIDEVGGSYLGAGGAIKVKTD
ncbi:hypothetical protein ACFQO1_12675 [Jejudonia soesokkakensis]|uniref:Auto-transporter adhesin head GIN domain-containing protein n=1 Tax=Jejudonia soesokkakensis TaxID=1323432 RepID=A0ABW2MUZ5_9FLAO